MSQKGIRSQRALVVHQLEGFARVDYEVALSHAPDDSAWGGLAPGCPARSPLKLRRHTCSLLGPLAR